MRAFDRVIPPPGDLKPFFHELSTVFPDLIRMWVNGG